MKKRLFFILALASFFAISSCSSDDFIQEDSTEQVVNNSDKNAKAREAGKKILDSFGMTRSQSLNDDGYPDYYGGGYINDNGKLVVYIKGDIEANTVKLSKGVKDDAVVYIQGNYSYKELKSLLNRITSYIESNHESLIAKNIKCYYLNDFGNNVVVELEECSNTDVDAFNTEVIHSSGIVFKKSTRRFTPHSLSPGDALEYSSVGYRARRWGTQGVVTAGHAYGTGETVRSANGQNIGYCDYSIKQGTVDAAFIVITNYSYLPDNGNLTGEEFNIWAGDNVTKLGKVISQSSGYIQSTSINVNSSGVLLTDMAEATYLSAPGDSGGTVYLNGSRKVVGIHQGSASFTAIFCKVSNISSRLNINFD